MRIATFFERGSDTKLSTWVRGVSRYGILCGVLFVVPLSMGGCLDNLLGPIGGNPCAKATVDDNVPCTVDTCAVVSGKAVVTHTPKTCATGLVCDPTNGVCVECIDNDGCNDHDICTTDTCGADNICAHAVVADCCHVDTDCDDGDPCTDDVCVNGRWRCRFDPVQCELGQVCDRGTGGCTTGHGNPCAENPCGPGCCPDDGITCTDDRCAPGTTQCAHIDNCPAGELCDADTGRCVSVCGSDCDDNEACTTDACDSTTHTCTYTPKDCDDNVPCTNDTCTAGVCGHTENCPAGEACNTTTGLCDTGTPCTVATQATDCPDDGLFCNGGESCDAATLVCKHAGDPCPGAQTCDEIAKLCKCSSTADCSSGKTCAPDTHTCVSSSCQEGFVLFEGNCVPAGSLGLEFLPPQTYAQIPLAIPPPTGTLPAVANLSGNMPTAGDQGTRQGSCTAWAVGYGLKSYQEGIARNWSLSDSTHLCSPAFIYNQLNKCPSACTCGTYISEALNILSSVGCASLAVFPYDQNSCDEVPSASVLQGASSFRIQSWKAVNLLDLTEVKEFLNARQPVVIGMKVYANFRALYNKGAQAVYDHISGDYLGGHAVVIVGYDDTHNRFKSLNSWGSNWGDSGYFYLDYALWATVVFEGYVAVDACGNDQECDDHVFCNGTETCSGGACQLGTPPCPSGVPCDEANHRCGGTDTVSWIYFTEPGTDKIRRVKPDGSGFIDIASGQEASYGVALNKTAGKIYWSDLNANAVRRANLDGSGGVETLVSNTNTPYGITLDLSSALMYWIAVSNPNGPSLFRSTLSGAGSQPIVTGLGGNPTGLSVDSGNQRVYWTNQGSLGGSDGSIWRVNLSDFSTAPIVIAGITLRDPQAIALDVPGGRLYWVDKLAGAGVYSAKLDGTDARLVCADAGSPRGIALDLVGRRVYWTNQQDGTIKSGNMDGTCNSVVHISGLNSPAAIALDSGG